MNKIYRIAKKTIKYIKYLQKNNIEMLQDNEGNIIDISKNQNIAKEMINCWQNKPIEILLNGKSGILYKNKNYILSQGEDK